VNDSHLDLEQLSDLLEGGEPGAAHVRDCGECRQRLGRLESARAALGAPPPPLDGAVRSRILAAALDAYRPAMAAGTVDDTPEGAAGGEGTAGGAPVVHLGRRRARRDGLARSFASAAAVVVILAGAVALVRDGGRGGEDDAASSASPGAAESADTAAAPAAGFTAESDQQPAEAPLTRSAGDAPDEADLRARLASRADTQGGGQGEGEPIQVCRAEAGAVLDVAPESAWAELLDWRGEEAVVYADDAGRQAAVMRVADCAVLSLLRF
jgi:hypothetical protein